jgi:pyruvate/oxaloacetate carboxyltransferase
MSALDKSDLDDAKEGLPKLYIQCKRAYKALKKEAKHLTIDGEDYLVFTGYITTYLEKEANTPASNYGRVMDALKDMNCVTQHVRGAGINKPSQWILHGDITPEVFSEYKKRLGKTLYKMDIKEITIRDMQSKLVEIQERLAFLESKMGVRDGKDKY